MGDDNVNWAPSLAEAEVGQKVWYSNGQAPSGRYSDTRPLTITARGRKLLTVELRGRPVKFSIEDGERTGVVNGPPQRIYTEAERLASEARQGALARLAAHGLKPDYGFTRSWPTDDVVALADFVDARRGSPS